MRIFFYETFDEEARRLREFAPPEWDITCTSSPVQDSGHALPPAPHLSIRTQSRIPSAWLTELRSVFARSTGHDHLHALRRLAPGPTPLLGSLPPYCGQAVAEQAVLLLLALLRRLPDQLAAMPTFTREGLTGREAAGRSLAVAGVGDIGYRVWSLGRGLGMDVLGVDPVHRYPEVTYVDLDTALARADVLICAMSLNDGNRGLFSSTRLEKAKPGLVFINVSRGECSPGVDLLAALEQGALSGVALDVFNREAAFADLLRRGDEKARRDPELAALAELLRRPEVILTPHNAFNTAEATERKAALTIEAYRHLATHGRFPVMPVDDPADRGNRG